MKTESGLLSKAALLDLAARRRVDAFPPGDWESQFRGAGYEFWGLREMAPTDAFRDIDWKATARSGRHYVREYLADSPFSLMILYDVSGSMAFGRKELLQANIAAALAWSAAASGNRCGLILFADAVVEYLPPRPGTAHLHRIVSTVAAALPLAGRKAVLDGAFARLTGEMNHSLAFILSDFTAPFESRFSFRRMPGRPVGHEVVALRVLEACEKALPEGSSGLAALHDLETGERAVLDLGKWRTYNERAAAHHRELTLRLADAGIRVTRITPEEDYIRKIQDLMKTG